MQISSEMTPPGVHFQKNEPQAGSFVKFGVLRKNFTLLQKNFGVLRKNFGILRKKFGVLQKNVGVLQFFS